MDPLEDDLKTLFSHDRFVRSVARGLVSDPGRVDDVVQETWWAAIRQRPDEHRPLLPWLARVARNFAFKAKRDQARRRDREIRAAVPEALPSTAALVEREAARRRIVDAVLALPDALRTAVVLRYFDGLPPRVIAKRLGEPVETVKSRLKRALGVLREKLSPEDSETRHAFGAMVVALARGPSESVLVSAAVTAKAAALGVLAMTTTTKSVAGVVALVLIVCGFFYAVRDKSDVQDARSRTGAELNIPDAVVSNRTSPDARPLGIKPTAAIDETPASSQSAPVATTGSLFVKVTFADGSPAGDVGVAVGFDGSRWANGAVMEARTNAEGTVTFENLPPGKPHLGTDRGEGADLCEIKPGERNEARISLKAGIDVDGVVVDESGAPVARAEVLLDQGGSHPGGRVVARTSTAGTFAVRGIQYAMGIWARAPGYSASLSHQLVHMNKAPRRLQLTLERGGGIVEGRVVGPDDRPVLGAAILFGGEKHTRVTVPLEGGSFAFTLASFAVRSDAEGKFRLPSLPLRLLAVTARARGFAVWHGSVSPVSNAPAQILVRLDPGVTLSGVVTDAEGRPAAEAFVRTGDMFDYGHSETVTDARGAYSLDHLPAGEIRVWAEMDAARASTTLAGSSGSALSWSPVLGYGLVIEGRIVDSKGRPHQAQVHCKKDGARFWVGQQWTDGKGRFRFTNLDDAPHRVSVEWQGGPPGSEIAAEAGVRPSRTDLVIAIPENFDQGGVMIQGSVVDPAGNPVPRADVSAWNLDCKCGESKVTDASGGFMLTGMPGPYEVHVHAKGFPSVITAARVIAGGESWDVGKIELQAAGRLRTRVRRVGGSAVGRPCLIVRSLDGKTRSWIPMKDEVAESALLAPGRYELMRSQSDAGTPIPFEITAGETTTLDVELEPAVKRTLRIRDDGPQTSGLVHIVSFEPVTLDEYFTRQGADPFECTLMLDPGNYEFEIEADSGHSAKTTVVIPDRRTASAVIPIVLR